VLYAITIPGDFASPYLDSLGRRTSNPMMARKFTLIPDLDSYARSLGLSSWEATKVEPADLDAYAGQLAVRMAVSLRASGAATANGHAWAKP
jgi:hypothetical protein